MFEGLEGIGTLVVITVAFCTVLATFGVRLLEYLIFRMRQKKWCGENDRRKAVAHNNPGNSSAVALGKMDVRLETIGDKLGVFHRDFFDKHDDLIKAVREVSGAISDLDKNEEDRNTSIKQSVDGLHERIGTALTKEK